MRKVKRRSRALVSYVEAENYQKNLEGNISSTTRTTNDHVDIAKAQTESTGKNKTVEKSKHQSDLNLEILKTKSCETSNGGENLMSVSGEPDTCKMPSVLLERLDTDVLKQYGVDNQEKTISFDMPESSINNDTSEFRSKVSSLIVNLESRENGSSSKTRKKVKFLEKEDMSKKNVESWLHDIGQNEFDKHDKETLEESPFNDLIDSLPNEVGDRNNYEELDEPNHPVCDKQLKVTLQRLSPNTLKKFIKDDDESTNESETLLHPLRQSSRGCAGFLSSKIRKLAFEIMDEDLDSNISDFDPSTKQKRSVRNSKKVHQRSSSKEGEVSKNYKDTDFLPSHTTKFRQRKAKETNKPHVDSNKNLRTRTPVKYTEKSDISSSSSESYENNDNISNGRLKKSVSKTRRPMKISNIQDNKTDSKAKLSTARDDDKTKQCVSMFKADTSLGSRTKDDHEIENYSQVVKDNTIEKCDISPDEFDVKNKHQFYPLRRRKTPSEREREKRSTEKELRKRSFVKYTESPEISSDESSGKGSRQKQRKKFKNQTNSTTQVDMSHNINQTSNISQETIENESDDEEFHSLSSSSSYNESDSPIESEIDLHKVYCSLTVLGVTTKLCVKELLKLFDMSPVIKLEKML